MAIPFFKEMRIGGYLMKQKLLGRKRYPLVLMLEPLFRCNLACAGCGKIDYPDAILNRRMSAQECWDAADECGAPMVAIPGGEPLIHKEIGEIVRGLVARKKFVSLCTNALLLEKKLDLFEPSPYLFFSVHLDGLKEHHDKAVSQKGVFDRAVSAIKAAKARGFAVNVNATIFDGHAAEDIAKFLDFTTELGVGVSMSPGYAYERAPDQEHFLNRTKTKKLFRDVFALGKGKKWNFMHSGLFLDFLAGNQDYECTPWGMPARNIFGWQKPCYLLGEGYTKTFKELMETTDWETYGTGKYEKCGRRVRWRPRSISIISAPRSTSSLRKCRSACQRSAGTRPSPPSRKPRQPRRLRSARLKSIPVETSARSVSGLRATPRRTLRTSISPFGLIAAIASAGRARLAGSLMTRRAANGRPASAA
jgi:hopanoid biosynthesis associated radical SAM protein HpnH